MKRIGWLFLAIVISMQSAFGKVLLVKQSGSGSASALANDIELAISEWFFEKGILALSEQNPIDQVGIELAQYMAQQMGASAFILWNVRSNGDFLLMMYTINGQLIGEVKESLNVRDTATLSRLMKRLDPFLTEQTRTLGLG
ncbi:hypothetical protein [Entomospira culicis]|uniref:Uncharacterized protein n=1 Tax=Entomospira culicis TaxID=2719989 RepID=A0A968KYW7_9SPIO|nr:hypothetical protein [Entomospira culicis]NIZ18505.1 hypothetical protein [Entomospira culicis]NIZ68721.1 hypothetical protein [Entomospira culicis]WDI37318.1 hypothetical protein PVA46_00580 [Entomospira culicis]WDI38947.1 hypothetical protein PVA47_00590 [Entomospira culicis]